MKLGFGLYKHMLNEENYRFARQCGATHLVIHLVDYFQKTNSDATKDNQPVGSDRGWGNAGDPDQLWTLEQILDIKKQVNDKGLELYAIENFDPAFWYDVLLDGPQKVSQIQNLKELIRRVGQAGIPCFGYNFSLAGVCSRIEGPFARGDAMSVGVDGVDDSPVPKGMVWNMVYDNHAEEGFQEPVSHEQLWQRLEYFLTELLPVAEEAGVTLAAHPDDPPAPYVRKTPRLVYQPELYKKLLNISDSPSNALEFCLGTVAEMTAGDVYEAVDYYSSQNTIAYLHLRNIRGRMPRYHEVFLDEGDIDIFRVMSILKKNQYQGLIIPDHTPLMSCASPWHAGMAYAMGYIKAAIQQA
jgi:mannonate dehydratase